MNKLMNRLIVLILAFYPIIRSVMDKTSGKIWDILLWVLFLKLFFNIKNYKKIFLCVLIFFITNIHNQMNFFLIPTEIKSENLKFFITILMLLVISDNRMIKEIEKFFLQYRNIILISNTIALIIQYISIFVSQNVKINGGVVHVLGTTSSTHMLGYLLFGIIVSSIYLVLISSKWYYKIPIILSIGLVLMLDARTIMIACLIIVAGLFYKIKNITTFKKILLVFIMAIVAIIILNSDLPFVKKSEYAEQTSSVLSGRDIFWNIDMDYYNESSDINKLFGSGLGTTHYVNYINYRMRIWAHNDFIEILVNRGMVVLLIYVTLVIRYFYYIYIGSNKYLSICIIASISILMLLNGFYIYIIPTMYLPILLLIGKTSEREDK